MRLACQAERRPVCILREDLDDELIAIADELVRKSVGHSRELKMLMFDTEEPDPRLEHVFQQAAEILSAFQLATLEAALRIRHRPREARFDDL